MNDTPEITRRRSVMTRVRGGGGGGGATFESDIGGDENYAPDMRVLLRSDLYESLGSPEEITVTVEPGDTLAAEMDGL